MVITKLKTIQCFWYIISSSTLSMSHDSLMAGIGSFLLLVPENPGKHIDYAPQYVINSLRPRQNRRHFADDVFKCNFLNENVWISIKISLKFVPKDLINNIPALVQIMAWCRPGDKPLSEPMMVSLLTHICITRPQWVNILAVTRNPWYWTSTASFDHTVLSDGIYNSQSVENYGTVNSS